MTAALAHLHQIPVCCATKRFSRIHFPTVSGRRQRVWYVFWETHICWTKPEAVFFQQAVIMLHEKMLQLIQGCEQSLKYQRHTQTHTSTFTLCLWQYQRSLGTPCSLEKVQQSPHCPTYLSVPITSGKEGLSYDLSLDKKGAQEVGGGCGGAGGECKAAAVLSPTDV